MYSILYAIWELAVCVIITTVGFLRALKVLRYGGLALYRAPRSPLYCSACASVNGPLGYQGRLNSPLLGQLSQGGDGTNFYVLVV